MMLFGWKAKRTVVWLKRASRRFSSSPKASPPPTSTTFQSLPYPTALTVTALTIGFIAGRYSVPTDKDQYAATVLPDGLPRTCCQDETTSYTDAQKELPTKLRKIVGRDNVIAAHQLNTTTLPFLKGSRLGLGRALCIVTPRHLHDVVTVVQACVDADCAIVPQGQNTGLTGGSVPRCNENNNNTRPTVLLSLKYLDGMFAIDKGRRVVCLAGAGLASLEQYLATHFTNRESHSTLGSTFLNPTTAAGVSLGSGGTQCRKGPAYTERALYLKVYENKWREKQVIVVNTLDIEGLVEVPGNPGRARKEMDSVPYVLDTYCRRVRKGYSGTDEIQYHSLPSTKLHSSDVHYANKLCRHNSNSVARHNADTSGPDCCRSEGKVILLASVHDTFPKPIATRTFWFGFDSLETALCFRKQVCLDNANDLPISMEYMDRDAFDVVDRSGRVLGSTIKLVGTSSGIVRNLWNIKLWIEALPFAGAPQMVDKFLHRVNGFFPALLPREIMEIGRHRDHHVALTVGEFGDGNMERFLNRLHEFASQYGRDKIAIYECQSQQEAQSMNAFRFVAAPAFRTWCVGEGMQGYSVDYALPKNRGTAPPLSPSNDVVATPTKRMRYSHFGCNVVHEDLAYEASVDIHKAKYELKAAVEHTCGGKLPAEHGHGTEYIAPAATQERWKRMDPLNALNPGVGGLSEKARYGDM